MLYTLLREHYVEDSEGIFRFDYPIEFLKWCLCVPGFNKDFHVGVRATGTTDKLLGFISGTPAKYIVNGNTIRMAEINFLCVHKKLRSKRLTPILIKEVTRRVNLTNTWSAYYTSGDVFPHPFSSTPYFHRNLNPKKNVETGFSALPEKETMSRFIKRHKLHEPKEMQINGDIRLMETKDISQVFALYKKQMETYQVSLKLSQAELAHHLMPIKGVIYTLVVENKDEKKITDFISFYNLPSQILKSKDISHTHTSMNVSILTVICV